MIYYHNITKEKINLCTEDLMEDYQPGDLVYKSESGNALLELATLHDLEKLSENYAEYLEDLNQD